MHTGSESDQSSDLLTHMGDDLAHPSDATTISSTVCPTSHGGTEELAATRVLLIVNHSSTPLQGLCSPPDRS